MMSTEPVEDSPRPEAPATTEGSPGAMIREARTRLRLSIEDLAASTKLARYTLDALERDDFNALQEAVYVRGYYRKCAKILGLDEARLVGAYQSRVIPKRPDAPTKLRLASGTDVGVVNPLPLPMAVASALVAVLVGVVLWGIFKSPEPPPSLTPADEPIQVQAAETAEPGPSEQAAPTPLADPGVSVPATGTAPAPGTPAADPAVGAAISSLTLKFSSTSWARVEDASGKTLLNGLMRDGENQTLSGLPPFSIFLGNGPGVQIEHAGKPVNFSRHVSDNLTARFQVPEGP